MKEARIRPHFLHSPDRTCQSNVYLGMEEVERKVDIEEYSLRIDEGSGLLMNGGIVAVRRLWVGVGRE